MLIIPPPISIGFVAASENDNNKGGRPVGTTLNAKRELEEKVDLLISEISAEWDTKKKLKGK